MHLQLNIKSFLQEPYSLLKEQVDFYNINRYIKLKQVLNAETLQFFNDAITVQVNKLNTIDTQFGQISEGV